MSDTILVTGYFDIDPAKRDDFIAAASTLMTATRVEEGCESYAFSADLDNPARFYVAEQWASKATMDAHGASAHLATFMGQMGGFGVTAADLKKWTGAEGGPLF